MKVERVRSLIVDVRCTVEGLAGRVVQSSPKFIRQPGFALRRQALIMTHCARAQSLMAFRKRNVAVGHKPVLSPDDESTSASRIPGVRPSPLTSHPVTSTGTQSLDELLGGHSGLALGSSLLIEESGNTDFAGALLRFYAAEGICQGHRVHVVGVGEGWVRDLPGLAEEKGRRKAAASSHDDEKMKIAWRYERLGQTSERGALISLTDVLAFWSL